MWGFVRESHQSVVLEQTETTEGKRMKSVVIKKKRKKRKRKGWEGPVLERGLSSHLREKPNWTEKFMGLPRMPVGDLWSFDENYLQISEASKGRWEATWAGRHNDFISPSWYQAIYGIRFWISYLPASTHPALWTHCARSESSTAIIATFTCSLWWCWVLSYMWMRCKVVGYV